MDGCFNRMFHPADHPFQINPGMWIYRRSHIVYYQGEQFVKVHFHISGKHLVWTEGQAWKSDSWGWFLVLSLAALWPEAHSLSSIDLRIFRCKIRIIILSPLYKLVWEFSEKMHVNSLESCPIRRCILLEEFSNPFPNVPWQIHRPQGLHGVRAHSWWVVGLGFTFKPNWLEACALATQQWSLATRDLFKSEVVKPW